MWLLGQPPACSSGRNWSSLVRGFCRRVSRSTIMSFALHARAGAQCGQNSDAACRGDRRNQSASGLKTGLKTTCVHAINGRLSGPA